MSKTCQRRQIVKNLSEELFFFFWFFFFSALFSGWSRMASSLWRMPSSEDRIRITEFTHHFLLSFSFLSPLARPFHLTLTLNSIMRMDDTKVNGTHTLSVSFFLFWGNTLTLNVPVCSRLRFRASQWFQLMSWISLPWTRSNFGMFAQRGVWLRPLGTSRNLYPKLRVLLQL